MTTSAFHLAEFDGGRLRVALLHPPAMFYALVHNNVPVVHHLRVENRTDKDLHDASVTMQLVSADEPLAGPWTRQVRQLPGLGDVGWDEFGDFVPAANPLVHANEAFSVM